MKTLVKDCVSTPMLAMVSATKYGAMAIGIEKDMGTVAIGKKADLVILSANPADNINNIDEVELVIKNGRLFNIN